MVKGFRSLSSEGIINGCVGIIDGLLCPIIRPQQNEVGHVRSFFSGHYQRYGINVQACCDHKLRFMAFTCNSPGGMNDRLALCNWRLYEKIKKLNLGYYFIADNGYYTTRNIMTPFKKDELHKIPEKLIARDNYNFFISQLLI